MKYSLVHKTIIYLIIFCTHYKSYPWFFKNLCIYIPVLYHIQYISVSMQHRLLVRSRWFYSWEHYCCEFDLFWDIQRCELSRETFSSWSHFQWVVNRAVSTSYYVVYYLLANRMVCTVSLLDTLFFLIEGRSQLSIFLVWNLMELQSL